MTYTIAFEESHRAYQIQDEERGCHVWVPGQDVKITLIHPYNDDTEEYEVGFSTRRACVLALGILLAKEAFFAAFVGPESPFDLPF